LIDNLLHPKHIGIIGVSSTRRNFGRIILENILAEGFSPENVTIIHEREKQISGITCVANFERLGQPFDLLIVAVDASHVPGLIDQIITNQAAVSVMLISGGLGETEGSKERAELVMQSLQRAHQSAEGYPVVIGANCMGVISHPGRYDTWFIPEEKLAKDRSGGYRRSALISQSGAFMLHRSHQCPELKPAYMISMGNQTDLTLGDMVKYFKNSDEVDVIAIYAEGFNDGDGLEFCLAVRDAVRGGKEVIFYKAGRTPEGKAATSGHTASLAGDYMVCESCVRQAGAMVARTFSEFQELFFMAETQSGKAI
jgi:acyl-CoA synthetase (NDP forming)